MGGTNDCPTHVRVAIEIWNMMGAEIKFEALEILCEIFQVQDVERLIRDLCSIREYQRDRN